MSMKKYYRGYTIQRGEYVDGCDNLYNSFYINLCDDSIPCFDGYGFRSEKAAMEEIDYIEEERENITHLLSKQYNSK